jgi:hypothetical protein
MNAIVPVSSQLGFADIERLGTAIAKSGLFGIKTADPAIALMMIAHAEGRHPALAARDYDVIQGRPAKKAEAMLRDFLEAGGKVEWHALTDEQADATFRHPQGGEVRITWDMARAQKAGLKGKDNYQKFPRQMLRSRCVSEGVRTIWPGATSGMYVPEEVNTIEHEPDPSAEPSQRERINAEVPMATRAEAPPTNGHRKTVSAALDATEMALRDAKTPEQINKVLSSEQVSKLRSFVEGAAKQRLDAMLAEAEARAAPSEEHASGTEEDAIPDFPDPFNQTSPPANPTAAKKREPLPDMETADEFIAKASKMSMSELDELGRSAVHRAWLKALDEADYKRVSGAIADRLTARMGAG